MNKRFVHAMNEHLNVVAKKDIGPIKFTMLLLERGRRKPNSIFYSFPYNV
jgi:hypothetical protein